MKKMLILITILAVALMGCGMNTEQTPTVGREFLSESAESIGITDVNFETVVREAVGKEEGSITEGDLALIRVLDGADKGITDISGIEGMCNLERAELYWNQITDLSPLSKLVVAENISVHINLSGNGITDLYPLASMQMDSLWLALDDNQITDISSLRGLPIDKLHLRNNSISDISVLADLPLTHLDLWNNQVDDISALRELPLYWLELSHNSISDLTPLEGLAGLETLCIHTNKIVDVSPLVGLTQLELLDLRWNDIKNPEVLEALNTTAIIL